MFSRRTAALERVGQYFDGVLPLWLGEEDIIKYVDDLRRERNQAVEAAGIAEREVERLRELIDLERKKFEAAKNCCDLLLFCVEVSMPYVPDSVESTPAGQLLAERLENVKKLNKELGLG